MIVDPKSLFERWRATLLSAINKAEDRVEAGAEPEKNSDLSGIFKFLMFIFHLFLLC